MNNHLFRLLQTLIKGSFHLFGDVFERVQKAEGRSAQYGQYLRRLYEIQSFMTVR